MFPGPTRKTKRQQKRGLRQQAARAIIVMARTEIPRKRQRCEKSEEKAKKMSEDQVMASTSFNLRAKERRCLLALTGPSILKEGKARTEKKYRSEKFLSQERKKHFRQKLPLKRFYKER